MLEIESSMEYSGVCVCLRVYTRVRHRPSTENSLTWKGKIEAFEGQP